MSEKVLNRIIAVGVFIASLTVYLRTLSPTVVFWDVGEFIAAAVLMQVPHPPGSPLFILIGRIVAMVPFYADIAARVHAISAVSSAISIMFLYLVNVKLLNRFAESTQTMFDRIVIYTTSAIGALTLAYIATYWFNATEAEVYGLSMLFVAVIVWLAMRWWEKADEAHNEKYLLLIAYLMGLSVGVHLLALLTAFPVLMLVYFRKSEVTKQTAIRFGLMALGVFFVIYPGIVQYLPSMLDGEFKGIKSDLFKFVPPLSLLAAAYGVYRTIQSRQKMLHIALLSFILIVIGYTTYSVVLIRANVDDMPMNENDPSNLERLTSYLGREQYGDTPLLKGESWDNTLQGYREKLFPRRYSQEGMHEPTRANYTSDVDFLWRYQTNHMFIRYVLWNFVGSEGDFQDAGVKWSDTWGIPLLVALFGIYYHFKKDWKMALTFMVLFIIMGIVLTLYQNQQEPQPRERDYFYVGAYFVLCIWISVGILGIIDLLRQLLRQSGSVKAVTTGVLALFAAAIPINLLRVNWYEHDRSQNYVAWDYSYNLLQSCEPDAILFTNGDNDTFPVWYLQDVEGVRRDVRVVNLSLVNTPWYIEQLKNQRPHGTPKVPISLSDQQIERISPMLWKPRELDLPVPRSVYDKFFSTDRARFANVTMPDTSAGTAGKITYTFQGYAIRQDTRILRVQDIMVRDIITTNNWERPIYFAATCSPDSKIGLDNYLWMQGQAYKLKPFKISSSEGGVDADLMEANIMATDVTPSKTFQHGFLFRNLNNPGVHYDDNVQRMVMNYRATFIRLAEQYARVLKNREKAKAVLARMEEVVPIEVVPMQDWRYMVYLMRVYKENGDEERFTKYATQVEARANSEIASPDADQNRQFEPYQILLEVYDLKKDYAAALAILKKLEGLYPTDPEIKRRIQFYEEQVKQGVADTSTKK